MKVKIPGELVVFRIFSRKKYIKKYIDCVDIAKIHIGCGDRIFNGWLNCDKYMSCADIYMNVYAKFPFGDNTFEKAYSEHLIEHLHPDKMQHFFKEIYRVLSDGGILRVTCPDLYKYAQAYVEGDSDFYRQVTRGLEWKTKSHPELAWILRSNGSAFVANIVREYYNHKWMYDFSTLESCLREVGFAQVVQQEYANSIDLEMAKLDSTKREFETLYIDAVKREE